MQRIASVRRFILSAAILCASVAILAPAAVSAADLKLLCAGALRPLLDEVAGPFAKAAHAAVMTDCGEAAVLVARVEKGEIADLIVIPAEQIDKLAAAGKLTGGQIAIGKIGIGVFVGKDASKPDVSSAEALKRSLAGAKSIAYPDPSAGGFVGPHVANLLRSLKISPATLKALSPPEVFASVARGENELGFGAISTILANPRVALAGPLPPEMQRFTLFAGAVLASSREPEISRELLRFLAAPEAQIIARSKGFDAP